MSGPAIPGIPADYGGEVADKRPSPLPFLLDNTRHGIRVKVIVDLDGGKYVD
jgi:hypothetical protein